ncbi:MAG: LysR family transcriptional regulator [Dehalococcoidia bacterium]|nr:LysR family transcriptional regulator [Dehalococcoidia bacterium]
MLSLYQFSIFLAVAETCSFSAAAHKLHLTQPAVSQQIRSLERNLGVLLFGREGQRIGLTADAVSLLPVAREFMEMAQRVEDVVANLKGTVAGHLVIVASAAPCKYLLPQIADLFRKEHPSVRLVLRLDESVDVISALREQEADLGFTCYRPSEKGFEGKRFCREELLLLVPRRHRWAKLAMVRPQELKSADLIALGGSTGTRKSFDDLLRKNGITPGDLSIVMEVGSSEAAAMAVEAGFGVALISNAIVRRIGGSKVRAVPLEGAPCVRDVYMIRNRQKTPSLAQLRFSEFLKSAATIQLVEEHTAGGIAVKEKRAE